MDKKGLKKIIEEAIMDTKKSQYYQEEIRDAQRVLMKSIVNGEELRDLVYNTSHYADEKQYKDINDLMKEVKKDILKALIKELQIYIKK